MKTYTCKLRLAGAVHNEVPKIGVTAPEIVLLRWLHGADSVVDIKEAGDAARNDRQERARLDKLYAEGNIMEAMEKKRAKIIQLLGHPTVPLPQSVEDLAPPSAEEPVEDEDDAFALPPAAPPKAKRTVVTA